MSLIFIFIFIFSTFNFRLRSLIKKCCYHFIYAHVKLFLNFLKTVAGKITCSFFPSICYICMFMNAICL